MRWAEDAPRRTEIDWPIEKDLAFRALRALESHFGRALPVLLGEFEHCVLHDVECSLLLTHGEQRLFVCASFHLGEKVGQFPVGSQCVCLVGLLCSGMSGSVSWRRRRHEATAS